MSGIANQLATFVFTADSEQQLKKNMLEVAFVLNYDYGMNNQIVNDFIHALYDELNDKEANKTDNCDVH